MHGLLHLVVYFVTVTSSLALDGSLVYHVAENRPPGVQLGDIAVDVGLARIYNASALDSLTFSIEASAHSALFRIDSEEGLLYTAASLDREGLPTCTSAEECRLEIDIKILPAFFFQIIKVEIFVVDADDNAPEFEESSLTLHVPENSMSKLAIPAPRDRDSPAYGIKSYRLTSASSNADFPFYLEPSSPGADEIYLSIRRELDREAASEYNMTITAFGPGTPAKSGTLEVTVKVLDVNDNAPTFTRSEYNLTVSENIGLYTTILTLTATDRDLGDNGQVGYEFSEASARFYSPVLGLDGETGALYTKGALDYEKATSLNLVVVAKDMAADNPLSSQAAVHVRINDINDNPPVMSFNFFSKSCNSTCVTLNENVHAGHPLAHVSVSDLDSGANGQVTCVVSSDFFTLRSILQTDYMIDTNFTSDREQRASYSLSILCTDKGSPSLSMRRTVFVVILDENDNAPAFQQNIYDAGIFKDSGVGSFVAQVSATDADAGSNGTISYSIAEHMDSVFQIGPTSGNVTLRVVLDGHPLGNLRFINVTVVATDGGNTPRSTTATVQVEIIDVTVTPPTFTQSEFSFEVAENRPVNSTVGQLVITDAKHLMHLIQLDLEASGDVDQRVFRVDASSGMVYTSQMLDREKQAEYNVTASAKFVGRDVRTSVNVIVKVLDENDNSPIITHPSPSQPSVLHVDGSVPVGKRILSVLATDADQDTNALLTYFIASGNDQGYFSMNKDTGFVYLERDITDVQLELVELLIKVQDNGVPRLTSSVSLKVAINGTSAGAATVVTPGSAEGGGILAEFSRPWVIAVLSASGALILLVIIIVVVVRKQCRTDKKCKDMAEKLESIEQSNNNANELHSLGGSSAAGQTYPPSDASSSETALFGGVSGTRSGEFSGAKQKQRNVGFHALGGIDSDSDGAVSNDDSGRGSSRTAGGYQRGSLVDTYIPEDGPYESDRAYSPALRPVQPAGRFSPPHDPALRPLHQQPRPRYHGHPVPQSGYRPSGARRPRSHVNSQGYENPEMAGCNQWTGSEEELVHSGRMSPDEFQAAMLRRGYSDPPTSAQWCERHFANPNYYRDLDNQYHLPVHDPSMPNYKLDPATLANTPTGAATQIQGLVHRNSADAEVGFTMDSRNPRLSYPERRLNDIQDRHPSEVSNGSPRTTGGELFPPDSTVAPNFTRGPFPQVDQGLPSQHVSGENGGRVLPAVNVDVHMSASTTTTDGPVLSPMPATQSVHRSDPHTRDATSSTYQAHRGTNSVVSQPNHNQPISAVTSSSHNHPHPAVAPPNHNHPHPAVAPPFHSQPNLAIAPPNHSQPNSAVAPPNHSQHNPAVAPPNHNHPQPAVAPPFHSQPNLAIAPPNHSQPNLAIAPPNHSQPNSAVAPPNHNQRTEPPPQDLIRSQALATSNNNGPGQSASLDNNQSPPMTDNGASEVRGHQTDTGNTQQKPPQAGGTEPYPTDVQIYHL